MSNTTSTTTTTATPNHLALATTWYAGTEIGSDPETLGYAADAIGEFAKHEGRMPREAAEVDAWSNSTEEYAEYLAAHPVAKQADDMEQDPTAVAAELAARQEEARAKAEEAVDAVRESVVTAVKAMVKSLRHGERALCRGYIDAGMYAHQVVQGKLKLGDKRAVAVQLVEGQLALYASDTVDANRLIRCWAAYDLLVAKQGLEKEAANVPYGVYRDAWGLLVERTNKDTAEESYVLLPGVEQMCLDHFKRSTLDGLSKQACIDWAKVCQREALVVIAKAKALAEEQTKAARIKADQEAAEARKATQAAAAAKQAAQEAAEQANAEAAEAEQEVVAAAKTGDAEAVAAAKLESDRLALEAKAKQDLAVQARRVADEKAKADEKARLEAELTAKQADRAKAEALVASERQATAEAKRLELERKAAEREANKGSRTAKAKPAGENLVPTPKDASPKDVAEWMAKCMLANGNPDAVFLELLALLVNAPTESPVAAFKHEGVQDAIMAAAWSLQDSLDKADAAAKAKQEQGKCGEQAEEPSDAELAKLETAGVA